jgi:hypothetical protein
MDCRPLIAEASRLGPTPKRDLVYGWIAKAEQMFAQGRLMKAQEAYNRASRALVG